MRTSASVVDLDQGFLGSLSCSSELCGVRVIPAVDVALSRRELGVVAMDGRAGQVADRRPLEAVRGFATLEQDGVSGN
jgi:hypothetical protein